MEKDPNEDIDLLVELLDSNIEEPSKEETVKESNNTSSAIQINSEKGQFHKTSFQDAIDSSSNLDPLELQLLEMEKKMKLLQKELAKKKGHSLDEKEGVNKNKLLPLKKYSEIHSGDTDSDEDEDNRNPFESNLNSSAREIKRVLAHSHTVINPGVKKRESILPLKTKSFVANNSISQDKTSKAADADCTKDPFSGIRIMNPLVTASAMREMMEGRRIMALSSLSQQAKGGEITGDWVTFGVIVSKSETKKSQKGTQYCIWQMSDLKDCTKVISLFLFGDAYKNLWKTTVGSVTGVLNPQLMKDRDGKGNSVSLSVNTHQKVLLMGSSKDLGWCQSRTKKGNKCHQFVNKNTCEFCVFHIQHEYQKSCVKRSEIQSSFSRVDPRKALEKRILGKDQVFYGGQLFTSGQRSNLPLKSQKPANRGKDLATLNSLSSARLKKKSEELKEDNKQDSLTMAETQEVPIKKDTFGDLLLAPTPGARNLLKYFTKDDGEDTKSDQKPNKELSANELLKITKIEKRKGKMALHSKVPPRSPVQIPILGRDLKPNSEVILDVLSPRNSPNDAKKLRAALILKDQGGIKPAQKNFPRSKEKGSDLTYKENIKKRVLDSTTNGKEETTVKKSKMEEKCEFSPNSIIGLNSDKFKEMIITKSKHTNLIEAVEDAEMDKYYNCLEKKEMLENKMSSTMEMPTRAVICLKCKYTSFSASDTCKEQKHPLKIINTTKRFFECKNCKQRTVSLDRLPHRPCSNCDHSSWVRTSMAKTRKGPQLESEVLSLRGNELGSISSPTGQIFLHI